MWLEISTFRADCTDKEQAVKVLEEAAEAYGAWESDGKILPSDNQPIPARIGMLGTRLADELADCITACCNLAERYGLDLQDALDRVERKNRERGRYDG